MRKKKKGNEKKAIECEKEEGIEGRRKKEVKAKKNE